MKQILIALALFTIGIRLNAQVPQGIPYQAIARNSGGSILASQPIRVRFTIHDSVAAGTVVYQETFTPTTNTLGLFNVNVGAGSVVSGTFSSINWGHNAKYMQVEMDPTGGTTYTDMGTQQMMSVPYALYAGSVNTAGLGGSAMVQTFTASGTWTKPTGLGANSMVLIECIGAGGGGSAGGGGGCGSGGGGGSYKHRLIPMSSLGLTETITIGIGGIGGPSLGGNGSSGGSTSFGSWVIAYGGTGGFTNGGGGSNKGGPGGGIASTNFVGPSTLWADFDIANDAGSGSGAISYATASSSNIAATGSYYCGGGGGAGCYTAVLSKGGNSVYGGGGGAGSTGPSISNLPGISQYAGNGGAGGYSVPGSNGNPPGGGGGGQSGFTAAAGNGARGECKITIWNLN